MRLKYVTSRILKLYKRYKRAETQENLIILPEDLDRAEDFWIIEAQKSIVTSIRKDGLARLNP